ncbi:MAG: T9SS type A sorting domain-containing protein [Bacteroidota bacterium]
MFDILGVWESAATVLYYDSNSIVLTGRGKNFGVTDSTQYRKTFIWTIDSVNTSSIKYIFGNNKNDFTGMPALKSCTDVSNISVIINNDTAEYILVRTNSKGDTLATFHIDAPADFASMFWVLKGKHIYVWGKDATNLTTTSTMRLLCIDTLGNRIWYKTYTKPYSIVNVKETNDHHFLLGGAFIKGTLSNDTSVGWYAKMDTLGNFVWEKFLDKKNLYETSNVGIATLNNNYFITSSNDASDQIFPAPVKDTSFLCMFKIDINGNPTWYKRTYISPWAKNVIAGDYIEKNGFLYARGNLETTEGWGGYTMYLTLLKLDSMGNVLWQRLFKQWYRDNRGYSLTPVFDGFIICADGKDTTHTTGITDAWVIKTDTNDCVVPGCHLKDGLVQLLNPEAFLTVYPNPANQLINIEVTDARAKLAQVILYDMLGNEIGKLPQELTISNCKIQTDQLQAGNYFVVIELQSGERAVKKVLIQRN